mmetsp:Transcript_8628/g.15224  ORF Transcript_8628/g.15224 Transcript_8628/m.15224 type:complete len:328 (-) Transcript_8628:34-1017(-)
MQTQLSSSATNQLSTLSLLSHILRSEGISSIYKGVGPSLLSSSIVNTLSFTSYSYFRQNYFHGQDGWDYNNALSGMMGAPIFGIVTTPENFLKTQMQVDNVQVDRDKLKKSQPNQFQSNDVRQKQMQQQKSRGKFTSSFHCARTLVSSHGLRILYTGHVINTIREAAFVGTYFFCYEGYKSEFRKLLLGIDKQIWNNADSPNSHDAPWSTTLSIPMAGGCAGATGWALTFPMDCVRAGVQGQPIPSSQSTGQLKKKGALEILKYLLESKGFTGLYAGVSPSIARAFLVSGCRFSAYEGAMWLCRRSGLTTGAKSGSFGEEGHGAYDD